MSVDEKIKGFRLDMSKGVKPNTEIIPPPSFSHLDYPFNYSYVIQNPVVVGADIPQGTYRTLQSSK